MGYAVFEGGGGGRGIVHPPAALCIVQRLLFPLQYNRAVISPLFFPVQVHHHLFLCSELFFFFYSSKYLLVVFALLSVLKQLYYLWFIERRLNSIMFDSVNNSWTYSNGSTSVYCSCFIATSVETVQITTNINNIVKLLKG